MNAKRLLALYDSVVEAPDAIARLRHCVLDLAVRGKLVEQDLADEPASQLLKRIAAAKEQLVKAGVSPRAKAVTPLNSDELPFPIPNGWAWTQIAELGVISPRNEASEDQEAAFVPMSMIAAEYGVANGHTPRLWGEIKKGYTHFAEGDVGIAKITPCFENGKSAVFRNLTGGIGSGTTELHVVRPLLANADYIWLFLKSPHFIECGIRKMTGTAGQKRVPTEYFTSSPFPLPPLAEQQRIVAKVAELMALCDRLERARTTRELTRDRFTTASLVRLAAPGSDVDSFRTHVRFTLDALPALTTRPGQIKTLRETILNVAVRGNLDGDTSGSVEPVGTFRSLQNGYAFKSRWFSKEGIRLLRNANIGHGKIRWDETVFLPPERAKEFERFLLNEGDIVLTLDRPFIVTGTKVARISGSDLPSLLLQRVGRFVEKAAGLSDDYLFMWINSPHFNEQIDPGRSNGVPHISSKQVEAAEIFVPSLADQYRTVAKVNELMALCDRLEAGLAATDATRLRLLEAVIAEALALPEEGVPLEATG